MKIKSIQHFQYDPFNGSDFIRAFVDPLILLGSATFNGSVTSNPPKAPGIGWGDGKTLEEQRSDWAWRRSRASLYTFKKHLELARLTPTQSDAENIMGTAEQLGADPVTLWKDLEPFRKNRYPGDYPFNPSHRVESGTEGRCAYCGNSTREGLSLPCPNAPKAP